jgi:Sulfotransferase family
MKDRPAPVLIVGAHRSGTTATARALELLGLQIGQHLDSHREPYALQRLHEEYLNRVGATWYEPGPFLEAIQKTEGLAECVNYLRENVQRRFADLFGYRKNLQGLWMLARIRFGAAWGWKEPRTTLFAPAWLEIFPDARVIQIIRHPMAAAISIRERELKFQAAGDAPSGKIDNLDYGMELIDRYIKAGEKLEKQTPRYRRVRFENIQADAANMLAELAEFCGLCPSKKMLEKAAATIRPGAGAGSTANVAK